MKSAISALLTLMAAVPVLTIDSLASPLTVTIVTDYPDAVFDPPEVIAISQWSTEGSNTQVLSFTKVYSLFFLDVDQDHIIEFDVRREVWGIQYEHHVSQYEYEEERADRDSARSLLFETPV
jgi:hypothetical protein